MGPPILGRRIHQEYLRYAALLSLAGQQAVGLAGFRVGLGSVGKGEEIAGAGLDRGRRLGKPLVEFPPPRPGDVGDDPVKYGAPNFVLVKAQVEQVPQKSTALRLAKRQ